MKLPTKQNNLPILILSIILIGLIFAITSKTLPSFADNGETPTTSSQTGQHFITIYDNGTNETLTLKTDAPTVSEVLTRAQIHTDTSDIIEPKPDEPITSENFRINIYRAKPAIVIDGIKQYKIMTAATAGDIVAAAAGITLLEADVVKITTLDNFLESGMPFAYTVIRAKTIHFNFYGQALAIRTGASTVAEFLQQRNITLAASDWLSHQPHTKITENLQLELYRQGKNTITIDEEVPFEEQFTHDYSFNIGYRAITTAGTPGQKTATYEIEMQNGQEISRQKISEIITKQPQTQQITLGARPVAMHPLTKSMGRNRYTTSTGIPREETFYDLPMSVVMTHCNNAGHYTVRPDGVKIDKGNYIIVAANLNRYPRCSIVETSLGLGKVYDTGTFAEKNPEQFDIATDWSKKDGI